MTITTSKLTVTFNGILRGREVVVWENLTNETLAAVERTIELWTRSGLRFVVSKELLS